MIRMGKTFHERWRALQLDGRLATIALQPELLERIDAPIVADEDAFFLQSMLAGDPGSSPFPDRTGREAFVNKLHVDDYITGDADVLFEQSAAAALHLARRLGEEQPRRRFRVHLTVDPELPTATLRFFAVRPGEPWGSDDPDDSPLEVLLVDTPL
jgi:hypothetical protein